VDSFFLALSNMQGYILCYGIVGTVGFLVGLLELLNRYNVGNRASWVLWGWPQFTFYSVNVFAAIATLFISETNGATTLVNGALTDTSSTVIKCVQIGLASMFVLRSRLITVERKDKSGKVDLGPSQILNMIYRYLDRLIDQSRGTKAVADVKKAMSKFNGDLTDLTALCLRIPESIPPVEIDKLRRNLDTINRNSKKLTPHAQALIMELELQREVGTSTLEAAVEALSIELEDAAGSPTGGHTGGAVSDQDVVSLNEKLDEFVRRFD
jgi:hypothetical protein